MHIQTHHTQMNHAVWNKQQKINISWIDMALIQNSTNTHTENRNAFILLIDQRRKLLLLYCGCVGPAKEEKNVSSTLSLFPLY
mmetsp:Transcript_20426/g.32473  ORF Transcript_20426/g.32473 Transcript_20426/m.32473 type:complete len:83 (+) Transcript_20426:1839-2087(+)